MNARDGYQEYDSVKSTVSNEVIAKPKPGCEYKRVDRYLITYRKSKWPTVEVTRVLADTRYEEVKIQE